MASTNSIFLSIFLFYTALTFLAGVGYTDSIGIGEADSVTYIDNKYCLENATAPPEFCIIDCEYVDPFIGRDYILCEDSEEKYHDGEIEVNPDGSLRIIKDETTFVQKAISGIGSIPVIGNIISPIVGGIFFIVSGDIPVALQVLLFSPLIVIGIWVIIRLLPFGGSA